MSNINLSQWNNFKDGDSLNANSWNNFVNILKTAIDSKIENHDLQDAINALKNELNGESSTEPTLLPITLSTSPTYPDSQYNIRGASAWFNDNSNFNNSATSNSYVSDDGEEQAYGDRVRFGSWYSPNIGQTEYNCSHDFIEIVNSGTKDFPTNNIKLRIFRYDSSLSFEDISLSENGCVPKQSSYLIRCMERNIENPRINLKYYDLNLSNVSLENVVALALVTNKAPTDLTTSFTNSEKKVNISLVDAIILRDNNHIQTTGSSPSNLFGDNKNNYKNTNPDTIYKDQFSLDPAKQAFKSLVPKTSTNDNNVSEATKNRLYQGIDSEPIPLNTQFISFPNSSGKKDVSLYTPKFSGEHKNVLSDKTAPLFDKPNMLNCSFGINAENTRCFNWFSMGDSQDEFLFVRKQGTFNWEVFESYKQGDTNQITRSLFSRKQFNDTIINAVYDRMSSTFPGNAEYKYTTHKCILKYENESVNTPTTFEYCAGRLDKNGNISNYISNIQTFTLYPSDYKPRVYQTTDQQGFGWMEYQVWAAAAEELNRRIEKECNNITKEFPILINTGDMTQNGTRINEWLDYYNGGYCLLCHLEHMAVIGNNDLGHSHSTTVLGNGDDAGKSSPYFFNLFYCYEIENESEFKINSALTDYTDTKNNDWQHHLIYKNKYIPSIYYFYFGNYGYLMVNSEITETTCSKYFNSKNDTNKTLNLYTGNCIETDNTKSPYTRSNKYSLKYAINYMIKQMSEKTIIAACHEMPYTVTTNTQTKADYNSVERSIASGKLVGSHLNRINGTATYIDDNYWFSKLLQNNSIKLCIGGHKHTYAITWPIHEVSTNPYGGDSWKPDDSISNTAEYITDNNNQTSLLNTHISKLSLLKRDEQAGPVITNTGADGYNNQTAGIYPGLNIGDNSKPCVVYFMLQATGFKQTSNKELPSQLQRYSFIVPDTTIDSKNKDVAANSQKYPMYGVISYNNNKIYANIYRVANITIETLDAKNESSIQVFNELSYCTKKAYSELLIPLKIESGDYYTKKMWIIEEKDKDLIQTGLTTIETYTVPSDVSRSIGNSRKCLQSGNTQIKTLEGYYDTDEANNYTVIIS